MPPFPPLIAGTPTNFSPFGSPLKIASKTDVSTATALTPPSLLPTGRGQFHLPAQIIQQLIHAASGQFLSQTTEDGGPFGPINDFAQTNTIDAGNEIDLRPRLDTELFSQFLRDGDLPLRSNQRFHICQSKNIW